MSKSLFNKNLPHSCMYCVYGNLSPLKNEILCNKHGVTEFRDSCKNYKYDPLKRAPKKIKISDDFNPDDFSL